MGHKEPGSTQASNGRKRQLVRELGQYEKAYLDGGKAGEKIEQAVEVFKGTMHLIKIHFFSNYFFLV